jgi:acetate kinase
MNILVFNSGSSSLKFRLLDMPAEAVLARGLIDAIGRGGRGSRLIFETDGGRSTNEAVDCPDHRAAVRQALGALGENRNVDAVGHRVVHGGDRFRESTLVDDKIFVTLGSLIELAPLHQPINLACLEVCGDEIPGRPQAAVFDTSWHASMPPHSFLYPVPPKWHEQYGVRRYGFHGSSHRFVTLAAADLLGRPATDLRLVTVHLGNGCSATAFDRGRVLDTSMGFTPLEGLMMGTRSGDFDPAAAAYVARKTGLTGDQVVEALNHESGLLAVSGSSHDLRTVLEARDRGDDRAALAVAMFVHRLKKIIGAYAFSLGGMDAVVFTGGIGQNAPTVRAEVLGDLAPFGIILDPDRNEMVKGENSGPITRPDSQVAALVIPTDEELMIARDTYQLVAGRA